MTDGPRRPRRDGGPPRRDGGSPRRGGGQGGGGRPGGGYRGTSGGGGYRGPGGGRPGGGRPGGGGFRGGQGGFGRPGGEQGEFRRGQGGPGGPGDRSNQRRGTGFSGGFDAAGGDSRDRFRGGQELPDAGEAGGASQEGGFGADRPRFAGPRPGGFRPAGGRPSGPRFSGPRPGHAGRAQPPWQEGTPPAMRDEGEGPRGPRPPRPWVERPGRPPGPRGSQAWRRPEQPPVNRPGAPAPPLEEGEELVAGRRPVEEAFAAGRPARRLLVTPQRRQALEKIVLHATTLRIPIVEVEGGSLTSLAGFDGHQGVAVVVEARRFASVEDVLARSIEKAEAPFVVVLDSLEDPQNVGTLLRSAEAVGVHGVIFPTERQAPLSPAAVKASAGATEHLLLAPVEDLAATLTDLHLRGVRIVGSEAEAPLTAREADLRGPIALVVGSEGHGLSPAVRRRCDLFVRLPMRGAIESLNAAVAGSVFLFEILGQREAGAASTAAPPPASTATSRRRAAVKPAAIPVAGPEPGPATSEAVAPEPEPPTMSTEPPGPPEPAAGAAIPSDATPAAAAKVKPPSKPRPTASRSIAGASKPDATAKDDAAPKPRAAAAKRSVTKARTPSKRSSATTAPPAATDDEDGPALLPE